MPFGAQFRRVGVAFEVRIDLGHDDASGQRQCLRINFRTADDPCHLARCAQGDGLLQTMSDAGARRLPVDLAGDDHVGAAGQGAKARGQTVPGLAAHDDRASHRGLAEVRQVFGKMPWHDAAAADDAIAGACINKANGGGLDGHGGWNKL